MPATKLLLSEPGPLSCVSLRPNAPVLLVSNRPVRTEMRHLHERSLQGSERLSPDDRLGSVAEVQTKTLPAPGMLQAAPAMRILFITANRLGDAVLSTGLLDHLLRAHPEARFTIACGPVAAGVFARMPRRDRTLIVEKRRFDAHWLLLWRQALAVWDLVVDLRGSALSLLLPARRRAILRGGRRPGHKVAQLAALLGVEPVPMPTAWTTPADVAVAAGLLPPGPLVALGPTANWSGKVWAPERFVALFGALQARLPGACAVVLAGPGAAERAMAAPVLEALPGAIDLCGRLSVPEASACLARCALYVGNDSGLMHLAAAAGTPTLGLFGPSLVREYGPAGPRTAVAVAPGPEGAGCMAALPVAAAFEAAAGLL